MNKKGSGILIVLLVVATLALSVSFASATKPETKSLTGTFYTPPSEDTMAIITAGESNNAGREASLVLVFTMVIGYQRVVRLLRGAK